MYANNEWLHLLKSRYNLKYFLISQFEQSTVRTDLEILAHNPRASLVYSSGSVRLFRYNP
ncbi:hypothetical protein A2154_03045 [Candidatus Gottesmanbacteria bacterium RBG_16_43_7]|uniref:Uncharacterized protein n=1 Tax=Candidatus Gottesmanbacteria bacterium RBG_16_43_7 TaxID=1798373 RepID=A0A1F5ZAV8_9BACT|nr:MAG: hypothetical protein A2154_03045 [Candidatus Gottesmanbacteria bacterium RBG_16_43_7]